jgi:hypothetical protein
MFMGFRFATQNDTGQRSALWSIFTTGGSNVALATTEAAGRMKISLHESGRWQIGYTSEYERRERQAGRWKLESRHWERWQRPAEIQAGYTSALKIIVPPAALTDRPAPKTSKPTRFVPARADMAVMFTVCIAKTTIPAWSYGTEQENTVIGTMNLPNGEHVLVGSHYVDGARANKDMLASLGRFAGSLLRSDTRTLEPLPRDATLFGFSSDRDGTKVVMEIALWSIYDAWGEAAAPSGLGPDVKETADDSLSGFIDLPLRMPRSVLAERGVDPKDPDAAKAILGEWKEGKIHELRRLFQLP